MEVDFSNREFAIFLFSPFPFATAPIFSFGSIFHLLKFLYGFPVRLASVEDAFLLLELAHEILLPILEQRCKLYIEANISVENIYDVFFLL